jgi:hypothetical protein
MATTVNGVASAPKSNGHANRVKHALQPPDPLPAILDELARLARDYHRQGTLPKPVTLCCSYGDVFAVLTVQQLPTAEALASSKLGEMHQTILRVCGERPLTTKTIARLAGYRYSSHLRTRVAELVRMNLLRQSPDGYTLVPQQPEGGRP